MSDIAIFIVISADELSNNGQLPGDLRSLRALTGNQERLVHLEALADEPLPEKTSATLHGAGALITVLPSAADSASALVGGLMARLHEFICAYAHVSRFILAGTDSDRLEAPAAFLQRAGYLVTIAGPDRSSLEALRQVADDLSVWSGRQSGRESSRESSRESTRENNKESGREDNAPKLDPYEVLVDEVTRGREKGQRVLLTSLKQRMRRRMRRFDETRLKDQEGRPMRKFKDFIADAANRDLIQLIENGNRSHVLLPGEDIPEDTEEEESSVDDSGTQKSRNPRRRREDEDTETDPLLDTVEMVEGDSEIEEEKEEEEDLPGLNPEDFDVESVNEDASAPPQDFVEALESMIPENGMTLADLLTGIEEKKNKEELSATRREIRTMLQNAFYNELLEPVNEDSPLRYVIVDDWKGIIDFL